MIRGGSGLIAHQLETVAGVITRPLYSNKNLFVMDGAPGVWRQVANPNVSDPSDRGIVYAAFGGGKISLTFDVLVNAELDLAGFARVVDPATVPGELAAVIGSAIETAKRLAAAEEAAESGRAVTGTEPAAPRQPHKRAAGSVVTSTTLPPVTAADGTPLPGSLAAEGLGASSPSGAPPQAVVYANGTGQPADATPAPPEETGFAPIDELEI